MNLLNNYGTKRSTLDVLKQVSMYCKQFTGCPPECIYSRPAFRCGISKETLLNKFSFPSRRSPCMWKIESIELKNPAKNMPSIEKVGVALGKLTKEELVKYEIIEPQIEE